MNDDRPSGPPAPQRAQRQASLRQALAAVAQVGTLAHIEDAYRDRFNYTEWRRLGFPNRGLQELAAAANQMSAAMPQHGSN